VDEVFTSSVDSCNLVLFTVDFDTIDLSLTYWFLLDSFLEVSSLETASLYYFRIKVVDESRGD